MVTECVQGVRMEAERRAGSEGGGVVTRRYIQRHSHTFTV